MAHLSVIIAIWGEIELVIFLFMSVAARRKCLIVIKAIWFIVLLVTSHGTYYA